jgi:hypothetical protein
MNKRIIMAVMLVLLIALSSCKQDADSGDTDGKTYEKVYSDIYSSVCKTEVFTSPDGFSPSIRDDITSDGTYIYVRGYLNDAEEVTCRYDIDGTNCTIITAADTSAGVTSEFATDNGVTITAESIISGDRIECIQITATKDDTDLFTLTADDAFDISLAGMPQNLIAGEVFFVTNAVYCGGYYYISSNGNSIAVLDERGGRHGIIKSNTGDIQNITKINETDILSLTIDRQGASSVNYIDTVNKKIGVKVAFPEGMTDWSSIYSGDMYDVYIKNKVGLYGYNISDGDGKAAEIINWENSDLIGDAVFSVDILSESEFLYTYFDYFLNTFEVGKMTLIPKDELVEKTVISLAMMTHSQEIERFIVYFNRASERYRISSVNYYQDDSNTLNLDIAAGKIPDLFVYQEQNNFEFYPIDNYIKQGLFADYFELFEKDGALSADILNDFVISAYTDNGKMYMMPSEISLKLLVSKAGAIPAYNGGWDYDGFFDCIDSLGDGTYLSTNPIDILGYDAQFLADFIDYENAEANFDDPSFKRIIEFIKNYDAGANPFLTAMRDERTAAFRSGNLLAHPLAVERRFSDIAAYESMFGGDIQLMKYPSSDGGRVTLSSRFSMSVSAKSDGDKSDGAWEFVKYVLSDDVQRLIIQENIPPTKSMFDEYTETCLNRVYAMFGTMTQWFDGPMSPEIEAQIAEAEESLNEKAYIVTFTQEDADELLSLLNSAGTPEKTDQTIIDIYHEEIQPYYSGKKSYDEAVNIMKSRIEIYLSEIS